MPTRATQRKKTALEIRVPPIILTAIISEVSRARELLRLTFDAILFDFIPGCRLGGFINFSLDRIGTHPPRALRRYQVDIEGTPQREKNGGGRLRRHKAFLPLQRARSSSSSGATSWRGPGKKGARQLGDC